MSKSTCQNRFFCINEWKSSKTLQRLERNSRFASFQVEVNSFQIEKTSVQVSAVSKLRHQHAHAKYLCWERVPFRPPPNRKLNANKIEQLPRPRLSLLCPLQKRESLGSDRSSFRLLSDRHLHLSICWQAIAKIQRPQIWRELYKNSKRSGTSSWSFARHQ